MAERQDDYASFLLGKCYDIGLNEAQDYFLHQSNGTSLYFSDINVILPFIRLTKTAACDIINYNICTFILRMLKPSFSIVLLYEDEMSMLY